MTGGFVARRMRLALLLVVVVLLAGCSMAPPAPVATPTGATPAGPTATAPTAPVLVEPRFDGERALGLVREQVLYANGTVRTRVPGTPGNDEVARWIADEMASMGYAVRWQHFNATYGCQTVAMHNVVAERNGTSGRAVAFAAHYDTRPIADKDPDPSARGQPIAGANDGGSGVAVLLELARVAESDDTLRFLFFDGEDGGGVGAPACRTDWILGSAAYAAQMADDEARAMRAFVLVDMVGDPALRIPKEGYSRAGPGAQVLDAIFATAQRLGHEEFVEEDGIPVVDDHRPFLDRGVPAVDLIHTTTDGRYFPSWHHTQADGLENVSATSLAAVGRTLEAWLASS